MTHSIMAFELTQTVHKSRIEPDRQINLMEHSLNRLFFVAPPRLSPCFILDSAVQDAKCCVELRAHRGIDGADWLASSTDFTLLSLCESRFSRFAAFVLIQFHEDGSR